MDDAAEARHGEQIGPQSGQPSAIHDLRLLVHMADEGTGIPAQNDARSRLQILVKPPLRAVKATAVPISIQKLRPLPGLRAAQFDSIRGPGHHAIQVRVEADAEDAVGAELHRLGIPLQRRDRFLLTCGIHEKHLRALRGGEPTVVRRERELVGSDFQRLDFGPGRRVDGKRVELAAEPHDDRVAKQGDRVRVPFCRCVWQFVGGQEPAVGRIAVQGGATPVPERAVAIADDSHAAGRGTLEADERGTLFTRVP